ncbi:MAG: adenylyl-sulfate kinase [Actinomycetia bacterium]|nr:adenylyl-sulfate kinase [Actinomycetes bacterium]
MSSSAPVHYLGLHVLNDLELVQLGLLPATSVDLPPGTIVDAEGAPIAMVLERGEISWVGDRPSRPYERWHVADLDIEYPVALACDPAALEALPDDVRTLLILASTDGDEVDRDLALVGAARAWAERVGCVMGIIPLSPQSPAWEQRRNVITDVLTRGGPVHDLTGVAPQEEATSPQGLVVLLTGLSGSGKSTLARELRNRLVEDHGATVTLLDGDVVRRHLTAGLGFSVQDRETNVERIGWVAAEIARHGGLVIASPIAPFERTRERVRRLVEGRGGRFVLVHVATPLAECERRDRKGLYARARLGEIPDFTGISSPYEEPSEPDLRLDTTGAEVEVLVEQILRVIDMPNRRPHPQESP